MQVGDIVLFGRPNGHQSRGEIVKVNPRAVKVRLLEDRGRGRGGDAGSVWRVDKSLCRLDSDQSRPEVPTQDQAPRSVLISRALAKLTPEERTLLAEHFRRGYIDSSRF
jgi:hypothetical protein